MNDLRDAHNHLQNPRLAPHLGEILRALESSNITRCVVNGTSESDWPLTADLARRFPTLVQPSFGLHPWNAPSRSPDWLATLRACLDTHPAAGLGECGLDRWIKNHDLDDQTTVFLAQLDLAQARNLPLSIHCLRAWGPLLDCLRQHPLPERGFLLHSYGGSAELVPELVSLGAWFSFSGCFLDPRKTKARRAFRHVPLSRLLVETDAPDMLPPPEYQPHPLRDAHDLPLNHPANLPAIATGLAQLLKIPPGSLRHHLANNFETFFGHTKEITRV